MSNRFYPNVGNFYMPVFKPVMLEGYCTVAAANASGYGQTGLVAPGVQAVYLHTSGTPAGSVNPDDGIMIIQLADNYTQLLDCNVSLSSPVTGAAISISGSAVLDIGKPYVITSVGTSTAANWQAAGLPKGVTPAVGVAFVAKINGSGTGTGQVKAVGTSGIMSVELVNDPNSTLTIANNQLPSGIAYQLNPIGSSAAFQAPGGQIIAQFLDAAGALAAPADGSMIRFRIMFNDSSVLVSNANP